jgi:anti-sigma B factor antagonist
MNLDPSSDWLLASEPSTNQVLTLTLDGEWQSDAMRDLGRVLERLIHSGWRGLVLDLRNVDHLEYRGVGRLVSVAGVARRAGGDLKLVGLSDYLRLILKAAGAHELFENYPDQKAARAAFERVSVPTIH